MSVSSRTDHSWEPEHMKEPRHRSCLLGKPGHRGEDGLCHRASLPGAQRAVLNSNQPGVSEHYEKSCMDQLWSEVTSGSKGCVSGRH